MRDNKRVNRRALVSPDNVEIDTGIEVPTYLSDTYWWAYLHPLSVRVFERPWLVNCILWGNYQKLCHEVTTLLDGSQPTQMLQMACVYGDLSSLVMPGLGKGGSLDLVDVSPVQLHNARQKLAGFDNVRYLQQDTSCLTLQDNRYDTTLLFFLLHEQPVAVREKTIKEAIRVTRPGGRIILIDYHQSNRLNPLTYVMKVIFRLFEPYAQEFVNKGVEPMLDDPRVINVQKSVYFGGLYQKLVISL